MCEWCQAREQEVLDSHQTLIEVDSAQYGFEGRGEHTLASSAILLSFAHKKKRPQIDLAGEVCQRLGTYENCACIGQLAFCKVREGPIEKLRAYQSENGIAQELQAFIGNLALANCFIDIGTMCQG